MGEWDAWIGREERRDDRIDQGLVARWCATLDRNLPDHATAPQGLHWCLGLPDAPTAALGPDGHPRRDDDRQAFLPPVPLPRRMWASSAVRFHAALPIGAAVIRTSRVAAITAKQGGSGTLVFVDVAHETHDGDTLLVSETQSLVYRAAAAVGSPPVPPPAGPGRFDATAWTMVRAIEPTPPLLFRYSALTFNSHRIHYDLPYATGGEGFRGLVVQGPLTASLLIDLARRQLGDNRLTTFRFRGISPAVADEPLHLALRQDGDALVLGAFADDGRQVMDAAATYQIASDPS
jgi:3-methylfumaryl-CoA hydratase